MEHFHTTNYSLPNSDTSAGAHEALATAILEVTDALIVVMDFQGRIVHFNRACCQLTGYTSEEVVGRVFWEVLILPEEKTGVQEVFANLRAGHLPNAHENYWVDKEGRRHLIAWQTTALSDEAGQPQYIISTGHDITKNRREVVFFAEQQLLMELIAMGAPLSDILNGIVLLIETQNPDAIASILLLDDDGIHLRHGAAPHLPLAFWQAIENEPIGPQAGSCGTAMFRKETVIVEDIATNPLWDNYRELALRHDLRSCWSSPIMALDGRVLGAFAIYHQKPFLPQEGDFALIRIATHLAGVALEKHHSEIALRKSEARFQSIASNVPGMVFQFVRRADGSIEWPFVGEGCRNLYNVSPQEIQTNPFIPFDLLLPDDRPLLDSVIETSARENSPFSWEGRYYKTPGQVCWVKAIARPRHLDDGGTLWDGMVLDITARKVAEQQLREAKSELEATVALRTSELQRSNRQLQLQFEQMPIACIVWDTELRAQSWNPAAERIFGYTAQEGLTKTCHDLLPSHLPKDEVREAVLSVLKGDATMHRINENVTKEGHTIVCSWSNTPLRDADGHATGILSMAQNITERHQWEQALQAAKEEAERANAAKSEFLSRMSHELRTPLNAILGFSQVLGMEKLDGLQQESVDHILRAGHHLLSLINEVLDISRVEANRLELFIEPVAVDDVLQAAIALLQGPAHEKQITVRFDGTKHCLHFVMADRQRLLQVLINLLSNGVKYNHHGGQLTFSCTPTETGEVQIAIADTGPGIAPHDLKKLFMPFERLNAPQTGIEGTGLGLALSRSLITAMNGSLIVESTLGQGSTFIIQLPVAHNPVRAEKASSAEVFPVVGTLQNVHKVLSIEDNISNYRLLETVLKKRPAVQLLSAMQGSMGLELAREHRPDLILLDLNLPDISGAEILQRLREDTSTADIPVIICSADATESQIQRMLAAGAKEYLTKPLNIPELLRVLDDTLAQTRW